MSQILAPRGGRGAVLWPAGGGGEAERADDGADSVMIRLRSFFHPQPQRPWTATYEIRLGRNRFTARVVDGQLIDMSRGEPHVQPDTIIDTNPETIDHILSEDQTLTNAINDRQLTITGDNHAGQRLFHAARISTPA